MDQNSGAYIFRPSNDTISSPLSYGKARTPIKVWNGDLVTQVKISYDDDKRKDKVVQWLTFFNSGHTVLNYGLNNLVEIKTFVDSIDVSDKQGKEIIMDVQFEDFANDGVFYTDTNGLELMERKLNYRPTWDLEVHEPHAGNFYPINPILKIKKVNENKMITMLNDRS